MAHLSEICPNCGTGVYVEVAEKPPVLQLAVEVLEHKHLSAGRSLVFGRRQVGRDEELSHNGRLKHCHRVATPQFDSVSAAVHRHLKFQPVLKYTIPMIIVLNARILK